MMSLDSCKTYPRTAPHLLSTTRALELCLHPSAFPPRMSRHKSLSGKHWLFWHEPGRKRGVISFVFPQEKKSAKINIFVSMVQPQEKYEHIGEEIKMMDLLADVSSMLVCVCVCVWAPQSFGCYSQCIVFIRVHVVFELYIQNSIICM